MHVYPIILDYRPDYLGGNGEPHSLLNAPLGAGRVLDRLHAFIEGLPLEPVSVLTHAASRRMRIGEAPLGFAAQLEHGLEKGAEREPNDLLLLLDARFLPLGDLHFNDCLDIGSTGPITQHLVVLENPAPGAVELVRRDAEGRVARIGRYYEGVTYVRAAGVACSLVPVSMLHWMRDAPLRSLADLRAKMAVAGLPARDVPAPRGIVSVADLPHFLEVAERTTRAACVRLRGSAEFVRRGPEALVHRDAEVDPAARLLGPVIVHGRARVAPGATLVGPATIGAGAVVERDASVAHAVVMPQTTLAAGGQAVHAVYGGPASQPPAGPPAHPTDIDDSSAFTRARARMQAVRTAAADAADGALPSSKRGYLAAKAVFERTLAALGLILLSPLLAVIAVLIKLESRGDLFFGHLREGRNGELFRCWKFRTMIQGADRLQRQLRAADQNEVDGKHFKLANDPRTTRLGRFLRRTNIDEIPQLFNVVMGQMSLIGPRPSPFGENQICVPWRQVRLSVRPGITGLWQICRADRESDFHEWIYYDMLYVQHMSTWVDTKIFLATLFTVGGKWSVPLSWIIPEQRLQSEIVRGMESADAAAVSAPAVVRTAATSAAGPALTGGTRWPWFGALLVGLVWSFWPTVRELITFWSTNEDYSVGALVPLIVAYLVWQRRDALRGALGEPSAAGLGVLVAAQGLRAFALYYDYAVLERYALIGSLVGLVWLAFGATLVRRTGWLLLFLLLMAPPPSRLHDAVSVPLQEFATRSAVFTLELLGVWVQRAGNVLEIDGRTQVAVAEACSGLRMLTAFVVVAATLALLVRRPAWQRVVLLASAVPVAVACNSIRLALTVLLYHWTSSQVAERFFHDFAGLVMMPLAVVLLMAELSLLGWLAQSGPSAARRGAAAPVAPAGGPA